MQEETSREGPEPVSYISPGQVVRQAGADRANKYQASSGIYYGTTLGLFVICDVLQTVGIL